MFRTVIYLAAHTALPYMMRFLFAALLTLIFFATCAASSEPRTVVSKYNYHGDTLYDSVEIMPRPVAMDLNAYLSSSLRYPDEARDHGVEGKVVLGYVIDQIGKVGAAIVVQSSGNALLDEEGLRVVWGMPAHSPGFHNGTPVPVYMQIPITFSLH